VVVRGENAQGFAEAVSELTAPVEAPRPSVTVTRISSRAGVFAVRARSLACAPCLVELRFRIRGPWRTVRMSRVPSGGLPGRRWAAKLRGLPRGSARWYVRVTDLDRGLRASSPLRIVTTR
jgi:hypothetical protein